MASRINPLFVGLGDVQKLALSRKTSRAVGVDKEVIHLLDTATGARIAQFSGHETPVRQVVFGPNDEQLVSVANDGTIGIWNLSSVPSGNMFDVVCALLGNDRDLKRALAGYPIIVDELICNDGYDPPLPQWMAADRETGGVDR